MNDSTWFDRAGNFHSGDLKVVERWTLTEREHHSLRGADHRSCDVHQALEDEHALYRRVGEDARLQQFKCVEFVEELMYGDLRKEPLK